MAKSAAPSVVTTLTSESVRFSKPTAQIQHVGTAQALDGSTFDVIYDQTNDILYIDIGFAKAAPILPIVGA